MELTAVPCIKRECAAFVLAPLPFLPGVLQDFTVLTVGRCGPVPPHLCLGAARGNPTDQQRKNGI